MCQCGLNGRACNFRWKTWNLWKRDAPQAIGLLCIHCSDFYWQQNRKFNGKYWQSYFCVTSNNLAIIGALCGTGWSSQCGLLFLHFLRTNGMPFSFASTYTYLCRVSIINNLVIINYKSHIVFLFILVVARYISSLACVWNALHFILSLHYSFSIYYHSSHTGKITHILNGVIHAKQLE